MKRKSRARNPHPKKGWEKSGKCWQCGETLKPRPGYRHVPGAIDWTQCKVEKIPVQKNPRRKKRAARVARKVRKSNPARGAFQVATLRGSKVMFLSGIGLSDNREAASTFGKIGTARKIANQVRGVGKKFGISKVAVVTRHDTAPEIKRFLLGGA